MIMNKLFAMLLKIELKRKKKNAMDICLSAEYRLAIFGTMN